MRSATLVPLVVVFQLSALLAGCLGPGAGSADDGRAGDVPVIREPGDFRDMIDLRPHAHDYWAGQTELTLLEKPIQLRSMFSDCNYAAALHPPLSREDCQDIYLPQGTLVLPGTGWVNFTVRLSATAVSGAGLGADLRLSWWSADPEISGSFLVSRENRSAPTVHVLNSTEAMNDLPHSHGSRWRLRASAVGLPGVPVEAQLVVTIAKSPGPVPVAPAHPSFYGPNGTLGLFEAKGALADLACYGNPFRALGPGTPPPYLIHPTPPSIVPVETTRLQITLHYNSSSPTPLHFSPTLSWRGADRNPSEWEKSGAAPGLKKVQNKDGLFVWDVPVEPRMWDSFYATQTQWAISMTICTGRLTSLFAMPSASYVSGDFHVTVFAYRDPAS